MSAIGNIFWSIFDKQQGTRTHEEAFAENSREAKQNIRDAGRAFASPFTTIRDAYRAEPNRERGGFRKLGLGLATAFAFVPLAARGLLAGAFHGLLALKNGVVDAAAHGVANMFDGGAPAANDNTPQPSPARRPSSNGAAPSPAKKKPVVITKPSERKQPQPAAEQTPVEGRKGKMKFKAKPQG